MHTQTKSVRRGILPALILSTIAAMMATHLYTPSLPHLVDYFDTTPALVKLTLSLNVLAFAILQLIYGPLSDRFGRRPVMLWGMLGFCVFSFICAAAQSIHQLIGARIGQGTFAAAEAVLVYAVIHDLFKAGDRVRALAVYGMAIALAPATAPIIGAYLLVWFGWRTIFIVIALVALGATLLIRQGLPESAPAAKGPIQISRIARDYCRLGANPGFMRFALMTGMASGIIMAMVTAFPFILITYFGQPTERLGLYMSVPVSSYIAANFLIRRWVGRLSAVLLLKGGLGLTALGSLLLCLLVFNGYLQPVSLVGCMALATFGLGPIFAVAPMKALDETDRPAGVASAVVNAIPMLMGSLSSLSLSVFHDGTPRPLALTLLGLLFMAGLAYGLTSKPKHSNEPS